MISYSTILDSPDLYDETLKLIENCFSYKKEYSYSTDFAPLMNSTNWKNLHILRDGEKVVAHIGARVLNTTERIPILLIGGIAVHNDYQKQGLFDQLFQIVLDKHKEEVAMFVLWSDLDGLYSKYNFHQAGVLMEMGSESFNEKDASMVGLKKTDLSSMDFSKLNELDTCYKNSLESNFICSKRDGRDWGVISAVSSTSLYTHETNGAIDFYVLADKGMDLGGIIHEFAGVNSSNTKVWLNLLKKYKVWLPVKNPWIVTEAAASLYMGIFRIGNPELFSKLIHSWSDSTLIITAVSDDTIAFQFLGEEFTKSHGEFLSLLMGPERAEEFLQFKKELWITGIDSV
ncbi:MAG: hypothetical protein CME70_06735 [Halobacteriovorax sp.]|nr:hypothetical protein [Halobacteriovorax sp.]|tara:strand:- start:505676 stop:506707 length:1032 start_codon:yes stop_codon:yes gene_type:complete